MIQLLVRNLIRAAITLVLIVTTAFCILRTSGDPASLILGFDAPQSALTAFRKSHGLDKPLITQYAIYLKSVSLGDFGKSLSDGGDALSVVAQRVPQTLALSIPAMLLAIAVGVPVGIWAAARRESLSARLASAFASAGYAIPSFVLGSVLVLVFSVTLRWLPSGGSNDVGSAILPITTLALYSAAQIARFTRSSMSDALRQPYIRTAQAKGVSPLAIVLQHALPNAAIPLITILGLMLGNLTVGAVVVENVFAWPGVGSLLVHSVQNRDLPVVQCILIMIGVTMVIANLSVDLLYRWVDPRIGATHPTNKRSTG